MEGLLLLDLYSQVEHPIYGSPESLFYLPSVQLTPFYLHHSPHPSYKHCLNIGANEFWDEEVNVALSIDIDVQQNVWNICFGAIVEFGEQHGYWNRARGLPTLAGR